MTNQSQHPEDPERPDGAQQSAGTDRPGTDRPGGDRPDGAQQPGRGPAGTAGESSGEPAGGAASGAHAAGYSGFPGPAQTSATPGPEQLGYGQSGYGQSGYGQSSYGQSSYGQPGYGSGYGTGEYGARDYGQSGYGPQNPQYAQPYGQAYGGGYEQYGPYAAQPRTLSITSMVLGIVGVVAAGWLFIPQVLAVIFGHIALRREPAGRGMAIAGLIMGYVMIALAVFWVVLVILFAGWAATVYNNGTFPSSRPAV